MYQAPSYNRVPSAQQAQYGYNQQQQQQPIQQHRRHPLTNATVNQQGQPGTVNHLNKEYIANKVPAHHMNANHETPPPRVPPKAAADPPLPRQNSKTTPPSPPKVIMDKSGRMQYNRVGFLGEVSFEFLCWWM
ncbi:hypothetical protein BJ165DRAFT_1452511 [Panaeolus papilionaceus]|nr:hypothetical protein BJ165DRAFT_1452511 [Panaeolus papilionaceus]